MATVTNQRSVPLDRESAALEARRRSTTHTAQASISDFAAYDPSDPDTGMATDPDVEILFKTKPIADIKVIERNARSECEQKKEELRLMVGERYRDMIDAADTILDMRDSVTSVVTSIESLLGHCQKIASSSTNPAHEQVQPSLHNHGRYVLSRRTMTSQIKSDTQRNIFYSVSTQMKLLVDAPEHLWNALEKKQYLKAAKLYLLSEYIYNVLRHNQSVSTSLRSHFPILHTQWDSMSGLKAEIASKCALELRHCHVRVEHVTSNLLSLILLDELSPTEILTKLLEIRLGSIKDTLSPAASHNPVHLRLLHCVEVVRLTIDQIYPMFVGGADGELPLLYQYLKLHTAEREHRTKEEFQQIDMSAPPPGSESDISNATLSELFGYNSNTLTLFRHLPLFIQSFKPTLPQKRHVKVPLPEVREMCQRWVESCTEAIAHGVPLVLPTHIGAPTAPGSVSDPADLPEKGAHILTLSGLNACRQYILRVISYYCDPNAPHNPAQDKQTQQHTHFAPHDTEAETNTTAVLVPPSAQLARAHTPTQEGEFYDALSVIPWATVCMHVLGRQLDLWDTLLRTPMLNQAQATLSVHFARVSGLVMDNAVEVSAESVSVEIDGRTVGVSAQWLEQDLDLSPVSKEEVTLTPRAKEFLVALKRGQTFLTDNTAGPDEDSGDDSGVDVAEFALPKANSQATTYITLKASSLSLPVYGVVAVFDLLVDAILYDAQGYLGLETYTGAGRRGSRALDQETHSINQHLLSLTKDQQAHAHLQSPSSQGLTHNRNRSYDLALSDPTRRNDANSPHARSPISNDTTTADPHRRSSETGSGFVNVGKVWLDSVSADAVVMSERMGEECGLCVQALGGKLDALLQKTAAKPTPDTDENTPDEHTQIPHAETVVTEADGGKERIKRVLLIADIARAISSLSVKIPACVMHGARKSKYPLTQTSSRSLKRMTSTPLSGALPSNADAKAVAAITGPLQEVAAKGVDVWQDWVFQLSRTSLRHHITKDIYASLQTMSWDVVKINEDNDQGENVESSISVPSQPHPKLLQFLCTVERLLAHAGGYGWDPTNSARLRRDLCTETLEMIDAFSSGSDLPQEGAIQLLFDLSVFVAFLAPRGAQTTDGDIASNIQRLETQIQSKIDPFDLSVLLPYLTENIQMCCRQLSTLLGLLDAGANHAISQHVHKSKTTIKRTKTGVGAGSLNMHNIMMLATPTVRFGTLTVAPLPSEATDEQDSGMNKPVLNVMPSLNVTESDSHADQSESTWSTITNSSAVGEQASQWVQKVGFSGSESIRNFLWGGQEAQQAQGRSVSPRRAAQKGRNPSPSRNKTTNMGFDLGFSGDFI